MNRQAVAKELIAVAKLLRGAFVDQPAPWGRDKEDELERVREEAEEKLKKELTEVKGRYYWEPGRSTMINITLTGRPLFHHYQMGGLFGVGYRNGVLTVNPQWVSEKDSLPSYKWGFVVDKMIQVVKRSEPIDKKMDGILDKVEQKLGKKIDSGIRRDIVRWCEKVAKGRVSAHAYPGPKGKEFVLFPDEAGVRASEESRTARSLIAKVPMRNFTLARDAELLLLIEVEARRNIMNGEWILDVNFMPTARGKKERWMNRFMSSTEKGILRVLEAQVERIKGKSYGPLAETEEERIVGTAEIGHFGRQQSWSDDGYIAVQSDNKRLAKGLINAVKKIVPIVGGGVPGSHYRGSGAVEEAGGGTEYSFHYSSFGIGD